MIDWERVVSGELRASSYCVRKVSRNPLPPRRASGPGAFRKQLYGGDLLLGGRRSEVDGEAWS